MNQPFNCFCESGACLGEIKGAEHMGEEDLHRWDPWIVLFETPTHFYYSDSYDVQPHIQLLKAAQVVAREREEAIATTTSVNQVLLSCEA